MNEKRTLFASPVVMLLSAAIFGFFGFYALKPFNVRGEPILFMVLLTWTLRISAVLFLLSAVLVLAKHVVGNLLYSLTGVVGAGLLVVVAIMDFTDTDNQTVHPLLLLLFAAWNGYGSWSALRSILGSREPTGASSGGPEPAGGQ